MSNMVAILWVSSFGFAAKGQCYRKLPVKLQNFAGSFALHPRDCVSVQLKQASSEELCLKKYAFPVDLNLSFVGELLRSCSGVTSIFFKRGQRMYAIAALTFLSGCHIDPVGVRSAIAAMTSLKSITAKRCSAVDDASLGALTSLTSLSSLKLTSCPISDGGL